MLAIQTAALDLIDSCLKELKRANPTVSFIGNNYVFFVETLSTHSFVRNIAPCKTSIKISWRQFLL